MITVLKINKQGNKITSYTCTDGNKTLDLTKEMLIELIGKKVVVNAKIQVYQGRTIIRLSDKVITSQNNEKDATKLDNKAQKVEKDEIDNIRETQLIRYIQNAKNRGIKELPLEDIIVNTSNLSIRKVKEKINIAELHVPNDTFSKETSKNIIDSTLIKEKIDKREKELNDLGKGYITIGPDGILFNEWVNLAKQAYNILKNKDKLNKMCNTQNMYLGFQVETEINPGLSYMIAYNNRPELVINDIVTEKIEIDQTCMFMGAYENNETKFHLFLSITSDNKFILNDSPNKNLCQVVGTNNKPMTQSELLSKLNRL